MGMMRVGVTNTAAASAGAASPTSDVAAKTRVTSHAVTRRRLAAGMSFTSVSMLLAPSLFPRRAASIHGWTGDPNIQGAIEPRWAPFS
jgi:hypothetical protein